MNFFFSYSDANLSRNQCKLCTQGIAHQYAVFFLEAWHNTLTWRNWTVSRFGRVGLCSCSNIAWPVHVKCLWLHKVHYCTVRAADPTKGYQQPNRGIYKTFLFGINEAHAFVSGISPVKCISI